MRLILRSYADGAQSLHLPDGSSVEGVESIERVSAEDGPRLVFTIPVVRVVQEIEPADLGCGC